MAGELILVVEDNERNLKLLRDLLGAHDFRTIEARSAEDAVALARVEQPALVLMDIQLPGMDGVGALQALRAAPETAATPVVAVTAFAMDADRDRLLSAGFDGYVRKPIDTRALPTYVRSCLEARHDGRPIATAARILVVDDTPENVRLLEAVLGAHGYAVDVAASGEEALERLAAGPPDLVLLDIVMPEIDGYEVCRRIRASAETELLPVIMITASTGEEKVKALDAGADDFVLKPFDKAELLARVRSLLRIKEFHETVRRQAAELERWNRELEQRVREQVAELDRMARLKRFLAPQVAELVVSSGDDSFLESHRREITVAFCDLCGFTAFAETAEPEVTMGVLREYHAALGELIYSYEGTLERFAGDGLMVFFNDPVPCPDPSVRAVRMAVAMRSRVGELGDRWRRSGHDLGFAVGIAQGYATLGRVGFQGRFDYAAIGTVTNLAARLCDAAHDGQILVSQRVHAEVDELVASNEVKLELKGFARSLTAYDIVRLQAAEVNA